MPAPSAQELASLWGLDPAVTYLNHGSFGACPLAVLEAQRRWRERLEREPMAFMLGALPEAMAEARRALGDLVGAEAEDLALVTNATTGVNTVLRSLCLRPGDELLTTDHAYPACRLALDFVARRARARVVVAEIPFPISEPREASEAILRGAGPRTRLALIDHICSPTGLVLPLDEIVPALEERGVEVLVDGAHAPGMLPLHLDRLGASYTTGNGHKWLCTPKGSAFLHVRRDRQGSIRPLVLSHGAAVGPEDPTRFRAEFDWQGTRDPTPWLAIPAAIEHLGAVLPGGWAEIMARNHALALRGQELLCDALDLAPPAPPSMVGALAALPLPDSALPNPPFPDPLQRRLLDRHRIEVLILPWPAPPHRVLRISAQIYNDAQQIRRLAEVLPAELAAETL